MAADNEDLTRITQEVAYELERFGRVSQNTSDALRDAQVGVRGFSDAVRKMPAQVGGAATDLAKAMYNGEKGAQAFNKSIDSMAQAMDSAITILTALIPGGPLIKATVAGLGLLAKTLVKTAAEVDKAANIQGDALYGAFQKLSKAGAVAAGGTTQLGADLNKLGLGFQEADQMITLFNENSQDLAMFGKTVFQGADAFAGVANASKDLREQYRLLGMSQEAQNEAIMGYVKIQTRMGNAGRLAEQGFNATAQAALKYTQEQDALTKLTGISRKEQEKALDEAMRNARFAATIDDLVAQGRQDEAKQLQFMVQAAGQLGPKFQKGMQDIAAGFVNTEEARAVLLQTQGEALKAVEDAKAGQIKGQEELYRSYGRVVERVGDTSEKLRGLSKAVGDTGRFIPYEESRRAKLLYKNAEDFKNKMEAANKAVEEQEAGTDERLSNQAKTDIAQQEATLATQKLVDMAITPATRATLAMAEAAEKAAKALLGVAQAGGVAAQVSPTQAVEEKVRASGAAGGDAALATAIIAQSQTLNEDQLKILQKAQANYREAVKDGTILQKYYGIGLDDKMKEAKRLIDMAERGQLDKDLKPIGQTSQLTDLMKKIIQVESGGKNVGTTGSSAFGVAQITKDTFEGLVKSAGAGSPLQGKTFEDMKKDVGLQQAALQQLTTQNQAMLSKGGVATTDANTYLAHFLGSAGALKVLKAPDNAPIQTVVDPKAIAANPGVFNKVATAGDLKAWAERKMGVTAVAQTAVAQAQPVEQKQPEVSAAGGFNGMISGPTSGYKPDITMHGTEQIKITPQANTESTTVTVAAATENLSKEFRSAFESFSRQLNPELNESILQALQDLVRETKTTNDINKKILAANR